MVASSRTRDSGSMRRPMSAGAHRGRPRPGRRPRPVVLLVDDDPDDQIFAREAFEQAGVDVDLRFADDGAQLVDWVLRRGRRADAERFPSPDLVLLDLRMPRKTGHEALAEIRAARPDGALPIVVLTTSVEAADARRSYALGANAHLSKPPTFSGLATLLGHVYRFWLDR